MKKLKMATIGTIASTCTSRANAPVVNQLGPIDDHMRVTKIFGICTVSSDKSLCTFKYWFICPTLRCKLMSNVFSQSSYFERIT